MSRICVKHLPKYAAEDRLREVFSQKGEVTDCKLMRTRDGKSRQFAFIGFRSQQEAQEAIKYFNKSYFDTSRITCEIAYGVGDPNTPQPWSRHSLEKHKKVTEDSEKAGANSSSIYRVKGEKDNDKKSSEIEDSKLQEFLEIMQPRVKSKMWANDMLIAPTMNKENKIGENETITKESQKKTLGLHKSNETKVASDGHKTEKSKDATLYGVSDLDYLKSRVRKDWSDSDSERDADSDRDSAEDDCGTNGANVIEDAMQGEGNNREILNENNPQSSAKDDNNDVLETCRLFVRNLPYTTTEDELQEHFSNYGDIVEAHLVVDKEAKRSKGIAFILYRVPESAARALEELDNSIFQGRLLHVMPAKVKEPSDKQVTDGPMQSKTFKQKREEERKASEASGNTKAWNSLYMHPDTVVENIARDLGVSKSEFFDRESDDVAVKVALGETKVIADTKKALANAGVNVTSLEEFSIGKMKGVERSKHVLLAKNLPFATSESELAMMFGKFGSLDKVILPPTRTIALVVFLEPSGARAAYKALAYKRYKDKPMYLEWPPCDILDRSTTSENVGKMSAAVGEQELKRIILEQQVEGMTDVDIDPDRTESRSLYVKNLNFKTSEESLKKHFIGSMKEGEILSVRIAKHLKNGKNLSRGYGFIEFDSMQTATNVCKSLQGTVLDGHALGLQVCHVKETSSVGKDTKKDKDLTKLHVKNVPFEATMKDLRQLFSPFGQIKALRLPKRFEKISGYAFVEYTTKQEAQNALQALSNTHIYGRHLVIEWAKKDETLEDIRAKTAAKFNDERNPSAKVSKKRKQMEILDESTMKFERIAD